MKLSFSTDVMFLGATAGEWQNRETGSSGISYKICVKSDGQVDELRTSKEVYNMYTSGQIVDFTPVSLLCTYDTKYKSLNVVGILPQIKK